MRQRLDMGWVNIYIINLMGEAWSKDIASLVREWQGRDIAPMMARKNVELDTTMISRVTHPDLVQRMVEDGVMGVSSGVDQLFLYRLVNVPGILNLFMLTKDRKMMAAITSVVQQSNSLTAVQQSNSLTLSASSVLRDE